MSLNFQEKAVIIKEISSQISNAQIVIIAEYRGLDVPSATLLHRTARNSGIYLRVCKNSLFRRAIAKTTFESLSEELTGPLIYGIGIDPVLTAKVFIDFSKVNERLVTKVGVLPNKILNQDDLKSLASLPSYKHLLIKLLNTMQFPIAHFAQILKKVPTNLIRNLCSIRNQNSST